MFNKQEIERQILKLNSYYDREKDRLNNKLFELQQLEQEKQSHTLEYETDFYIDICKHLLRLEKTYCSKKKGKLSCDKCKFLTEDGTCIKNWLIHEFSEFTRQAKRQIEVEE